VREPRTATDPVTRTLATGEIDLASTLRSLAVLRDDPAVRLAAGVFERATLTPEGPGAISVTWPPGGGEACVTGTGAGGAWLVDHAPGLLGCDDDVEGFDPRSPAVRELWRRHGGVRLTRTRTLWHDLAFFVVQQRIQTVEAAAQWRRLVEALGSALPGTDLLVPPSPRVVAALGYHELHRFGIERRRADALRRGAQAVLRWGSRFDADDPTAALAALETVTGVGPWTRSCLAATTWGDADAVIVGDAGIPGAMSWLLAGERDGDDARMLELLEPFRPHRQRVIQLAVVAGAWPTRRAPRAARRDIRRQ
jgi:3-methyladenine DNA glycosylase/8-oxoguanine DNA glycosylase